MSSAHEEEALMPASKAGEIMESIILRGDISKLSPGEKAKYYVSVCQSLGLNPLTQPLEYITLNGKLQLYARKNCTEQLRQRYGVSLEIVCAEKADDIYVVRARATDRTGRVDEDMGVVPVDRLQGENLTNAMMKAMTKAKRRVTLSICGLGFLDESEVDSVPARVLDDGDGSRSKSLITAMTGGKKKVKAEAVEEPAIDVEQDQEPLDVPPDVPPEPEDTPPDSSDPFVMFTREIGCCLSTYDMLGLVPGIRALPKDVQEKIRPIYAEKYDMLRAAEKAAEKSKA